MRRLSDRRPSGLFRGSELTRLLSMVLMLCVLAMMMRRAGDEDTWRFFTGEPRGVKEAAAETAEPPAIRKRPARARKSQNLVAAATPAPAGDSAAAEPAGEVAVQLAEAPAVAEQSEPQTAAGIAAAPGANPATEPQASTSPAEAAPSEPVAAGPPQSARSDSEPAAASIEQASADAAPGTATAEKTPATAPVEETSPAPPAKSPAAPLFRPHLPSHPEIIYQPGEQPVAAPEPLDVDPAELEAFEYETQALTDQAPLAKEEMPAYWRLMRWEQSQSADDLLKRARGNVYYGDLLERPAEFRGELLKVKMHVVQVREFESLPDNPLGIKSNFQAVGWNDASQAHFYFCIFTDLPKGMHVGSRVYEEGTFVGYFLKTHVYEDGKGSRIKAPILIGRMIFHPSAVVPRSETEWMWPWIAGGVCLVLYAARWGWKFAFGQPNQPTIRGILPRRGSDAEEGEGIDIEEWLAQAEAPPAENEINSAARHDFNGSRDSKGHNGSAHSNGGSAQPDGLHDRPDHGLDWTEDRER